MEIQAPLSLLPRKKNAKYLLKRGLGGAHSQSGQSGEEKHLLPLLALHPEGTSLYCLHVQTLPSSFHGFVFGTSS
jgi:hypothetical protein